MEAPLPVALPAENRRPEDLAAPKGERAAARVKCNFSALIRFEITGSSSVSVFDLTSIFVLLASPVISSRLII